MAKRAHRENRHGREEESSGRKRRNPLKAAGVEAVDYKNVGLLRTFLSDRGKIRSRRVLARRLSGGKVPAALDGLAEEVVALLAAEQEAMLGDARAQRDARIADVDSVEDAAAAATDGWARISWARLGVEGETALAQSAVTVRCLQRPDGSLPESEDEPDLIADVARSY